MTDMEHTNHRKLIEAALFMSSEPLSIEKIGKIVGVNSLGYLRETLGLIEEDFTERGFHLFENSEGWTFQVDSKLLKKVAKLTPYSDLPEGEKRALALVAYKEPIVQSELIKLQGNKAYVYVKNLKKKGLIKTEKQGRSRLLILTQEFERYFGQNKEVIREKLIAKFNRQEQEL